MQSVRVVILWHQHQPFYKDLVTGEYRLPWVRLHGLKDYYGMVRLLDEFPDVHQTFNLVPSLITQIQDYVAGTARDPLLALAAKPAKDLSGDERRAALQYLFQANPANLIGRYPRYQELWDRYRGSGYSPQRAEMFFQPQDFTDLQVLSQLAWFDEFFLDEPEISALLRKGQGYTPEDQKFVIEQQKVLLSKILPTHASAAQRGLIEISTSPFYHPILPLVCDTNIGGVSSPGLPLPQNRFQHPEDAREQLARALDLHQQVFGIRPRGVWPSEGSVSEEVFAIASRLGVQWMATDEGVLGRSVGAYFSRDGDGYLDAESAKRLYSVYLYSSSDIQMNVIFRDHTLSDLIGFVYSGMPAQEAAAHLIQHIKKATEPILETGIDATVPVILDGENAWEYYPQSGREFLRQFYAGLQKTPGIEAVTVSEAIARQSEKSHLKSIVPGSWINANFNVWIGAPEDNRAWDYLYHARNFYAQNAARASDEQRKLAFEELLICEGSDWNWWYGPEHQSANDEEFDQLYRKHLSNVYQALGAAPPDYLAQPIVGSAARPAFVPQTAYIHPRICGDLIRYFEWIGAAMYTADQRSGSMHGKSFVLDSAFAGIDEENLYGRLDFVAGLPDSEFELVVHVESWAEGQMPVRVLRFEVVVKQKAIESWTLLDEDTDELIGSSDGHSLPEKIKVVTQRNFEFKMPLAWLSVRPSGGDGATSGRGSRLRLRFSMWQHKLPVDALPLEGWIELQVVSEAELAAAVF